MNIEGLNIEEFVDVCIAHGVSISLAGDNLRLTKREDTPGELIETIKTRKSELIAWIKTQQKRNAAKHDVINITKADRGEKYFPLSYSQERLWFVDRLEKSWQYNISETVRCQGRLDESAMLRALNTILDRHEVFRTTFTEIDGVPFQTVNAPRPIVPNRFDMTRLRGVVLDAEIRLLAAEEAMRVFDLTRDQLLQVGLVVVSENEHVLLLTTHHIAADGWSMGVLVKEFMALYETYRSESEAKSSFLKLPELPVQYIDYACWQKSEFQRRHVDDALKRALARLEGIPQLHALPLDFARPVKQAFTGDTYRQLISPGTLSKLHALSRQSGTTLFMLLQCVYALLIGRWSNENDIVIGSPTAGRTHSELQPLIGFFLNNIVLRNKLACGQSFLDYLAAAKEDALAAISDQFLPFEMLVEAANPERSLSYSPLFQLVFVLQNTEPANFSLDGLKVQSQSHHSVKFDLELSARESPSGLALDWIYADTLFKRSTVVRLAESFELLLNGILDAPETDVFRLPVVPAEDLANLAQWSQWSQCSQGSDALVSPNLSLTPLTRVYTMFAQQAQATPHAIAVKCNGSEISYRDLYEKSCRLAMHLREEGVSGISRVGLCMHRSIEQVIGILGILATGAAYVPLDPAHPKDMLDWIVKDAGLGLVLISSTQLEKISLRGIDVILMDDALAPDWLGAFSGWGPCAESCTESWAGSELMYILYTSGSTGKPKGVMVPHTGVVNYLTHAAAQYGIEQHAGAVMSTPLCFDATVTTLYLPLISGKTLILLPEGQAELTASLAACMFGGENGFLFKVTPAHLDLLAEYMHGKYLHPDPGHTIVVGGEQFTRASVLQWKKELRPASTFINEYGPTETVVGCSTFQIREQADLKALFCRTAVPIGRPIHRTMFRVLNPMKMPCPVGTAGELYIGGKGVTKGYLSRDALTAEKFMHFDATRWYRSGDLVRYLANGELEFIGRADNQVKIRGFRVELEEIEAVIDEHPSVGKSAVVVEEAVAGKRLVAFIVPAGAYDDKLRASLPAQVKQHVRKKLPEYMAPELVQVVDSFRITVNGKLDAKAMLAMLTMLTGEAERIVEPETASEQKLSGIWGVLLGRDRISIDHNFFDIGGHSLLAARMVSEINHQFHDQLRQTFTLKDVFELRTIREMALHVDFLMVNQTVISENAPHEVVEW